MAYIHNFIMIMIRHGIHWIHGTWILVINGQGLRMCHPDWKDPPHMHVWNNVQQHYVQFEGYYHSFCYTEKDNYIKTLQLLQTQLSHTICTIMSSPAVKSWQGSMQHLHTIVQTVKLNMEAIIMLNTVLPGAHKPRIAGQAASNSAWYNYSNGTSSGPTTSRACPNMETALYTSIPYSWKFSAEAL